MIVLEIAKKILEVIKKIILENLKLKDIIIEIIIIIIWDVLKKKINFKIELVSNNIN